MYEHKGSYSFFNPLRFFASIAIALFLHFRFHLLYPLSVEGNPFHSSRLLWFFSDKSVVFVELFFIISGMLFVLVYLPRIEERKYTFDSFFMHRAIRLYPLAMLTSLVVFVVQVALYRGGFGLYDEKGSVNLVALSIDLLFAGRRLFNAESTNNMSIWYINVLLFCSIIAYGISCLYRRYHSKLMFAIPIFVGISIMYQGIEFAFLNKSVARGLIAFFEGCILEFAFQRVDHLQRATKRVLLVFCSVVLLLSGWLIIYRKSGYSPYVRNLYLYFDFYVFPALIFILYHCRYINRISSTRPMKFLSDISFDIYLWNIPIYACTYLIIKVMHIDIALVQQNIMLLWWMMLGLHIALASLSHLCLERPLAAKLTALLKQNS